MPSEAVLEKKKAFVAELADRMGKASAGVLVDYRGITVADDTRLRRDLRAAGVEYAVVKNTLLNLACEQSGLEPLKEHLTGTSALAISATDPVAAAKILVEYSKKSKIPFKVKAGFVEGRVISAADTEALAALPPREQLIARALGGLNAPISGFVNVLNGNLRGLVVALNAIAEQKAS
ncbi:50S ribosomal protein L10 [Clostridia bacterium]|nr:50S ribosomal protein L10 [Clostridia bacterium]